MQALKGAVAVMQLASWQCFRNIILTVRHSSCGDISKITPKGDNTTILDIVWILLS
jgi:uncharacterized protein (UPF0548 family)